MKKHRTGLIFAGIVLVSGLVGGGLSLLLQRNQLALRDIGVQASAFLRHNALWGLLAATLLLGGYAVQRTGAARKSVRVALSNAEDETALDQADRLSEQGMSALSILQILSFLFMGLGVLDLASPETDYARMLILCVVFLAGSFWNIYQMSRLVALTKQLYPEKKGDILSTKFRKEWMDSCDEAEQQLIGRAAYQSMRATQGACMIAWGITLLWGMLFGGGILPVLAVTGIWLVQTVVYLHAAKGRGGRAEAH